MPVTGDDRTAESVALLADEVRGIAFNGKDELIICRADYPDMIVDSVPVPVEEYEVAGRRCAVAADPLLYTT